MPLYEHRATMLGCLLDSARLSDVPDPRVLSGLADLIRDIADTVERVRNALDNAALPTDLSDVSGGEHTSPPLTPNEQYDSFNSRFCVLPER